MQKLRPLFGNIVFKPISTSESSEGILLPDGAKKSNIGEIVEIGRGEPTPVTSESHPNDLLRQEMEVKVGDKIIYKPSDTTPVEDLLLINQRDILAVIDE